MNRKKTAGYADRPRVSRVCPKGIRYFLPGLTFLAISTLQAGNPTPLFRPDSSTLGPYPSDSFTVPDPVQKTGRRIDIPLPPDCATNPALSECGNTLLLYQMDGFSVNPRVTICFSDAVDTATLRGAVQIIPASVPGPPIGLNQVLWDPAAHCVYGKPDRILQQSAKYLLVVTDSLQDAGGKKIVLIDFAVKQG